MTGVREGMERERAAGVALTAMYESAVRKPKKEGTHQRFQRYAEAIAAALEAEGLLGAGGPPGDQEGVDWRQRAVAHAQALVSILRDPTPGTFGETWKREAKETVSLDLNEEPFCVGHCSLHKDGTLPTDSSGAALSEGDE